ncbi:MAG: hypothetical protein V3W41_22105 [Planctomycetota bacterium]
MTLLDEISPEFIGTPQLTLKLSDPTTPLRSFTSIVFDVDYSAAETEELGGIMMPLEMIVTGPSATSFVREVFGDQPGGISQRDPPSSIAFTPQEGGRFNVMIREVGHNKLFGTLRVDVEGTINDPGAGQGQDA